MKEKKEIYKLKAILIKNLSGTFFFLIEIEMLIPKLICKWKQTRIGKKRAETLLKNDLGRLTLSDTKTFYKGPVHNIRYHWCPVGWKTDCRNISINTEKLKIFFCLNKSCWFSWTIQRRKWNLTLISST